MKKILISIASALILLAVFLFAFDNWIMPWYVESPEITVPNVIGMNKEVAAKTLVDAGLLPVVEGPKYDNQNPRPENEIMLQNPNPGAVVKLNRRIYIFYSGGEPKVFMPNLVGKTLRDAKVIFQRNNLVLGKIKNVRNEMPAKTIVDQEYEPGTLLEKNTTVDLSISIGPKLGHIRTPGLLGLSLRQTRKKLRESSLFVGKIKYEKSPNALTNTVIDQEPVPGKLIAVGDSVNITITKR